MHSLASEQLMMWRHQRVNYVVGVLRRRAARSVDGDALPHRVAPTLAAWVAGCAAAPVHVAPLAVRITAARVAVHNARNNAEMHHVHHVGDQCWGRLG